MLTKLAAADGCIWLDEVQYTKGGWTARNRAPDGSWLTVPVERQCTYKPINRVRIGNPRDPWQEPLRERLLEAWPGETTERVCEEIMRPYGLLVGLNSACLRILTEGMSLVQVFQSHLDGGHAVPVVSDFPERLSVISHRLAMMVEELGGDTYLSGPSGYRYLDEEPFHARGLKVEYWEHTGPNPCALATHFRVRT